MVIFSMLVNYTSRNYPQLTTSRYLIHEKLQILPKNILFPPGEIHNAYVEIDGDLQLNVNIYNPLVEKTHA